MSGEKQFSLLERKPYILAILISIALVAWMASGSGETVVQVEEPESEQIVPKVEVTRLTPESITRAIQLYGRTEPEKVIQLRAEVEAKVLKVLVEEGDLVNKGQVLIELGSGDSKHQLTLAKTLVKQRELEYKGAKELAKKGLQYESKLMEAKAALESARANVRLREVFLGKATVKAPFSGVLNTRQVEEGDFVRVGEVMFELVDLNPLLVHADVTEKHISSLSNQNKVKVTLVDGTEVQGKIHYIASVSAAGTNTFPIEVAISNPQQKMKAGISTEMEIQFSPEMAIKVSPAVMALDKDGNLGVKTVVDDKVKFSPIDIIKAETDGVWLAGFEGETDVITLGQGFVRPGDKVIAQVKAQ